MKSIGDNDINWLETITFDFIDQDGNKNDPGLLHQNIFRAVSFCKEAQIRALMLILDDIAIELEMEQVLRRPMVLDHLRDLPHLVDKELKEKDACTIVNIEFGSIIITACLTGIIVSVVSICGKSLIKAIWEDLGINKQVIKRLNSNETYTYFKRAISNNDFLNKHKIESYEGNPNEYKGLHITFYCESSKTAPSHDMKLNNIALDAIKKTHTIRQTNNKNQAKETIDPHKKKEDPNY